MKNLETLAFDLWRNEANDAFKRLMMLEVHRLAAARHNQSASKVYFELRRQYPNVSEPIFLDAVASLKQFEAIGYYPIKGAKGNHFHLNVARSEKWAQYLLYVDENFPHLCQRAS